MTTALSQTCKDALKRRLDDLVKQGKVPGIQYVVVDANSILFQYAGGIRDAAAAAPEDKSVTESTVFLSSSSTKVLTAAAVLKLVEQGKVDLESSLSTYYPNHPYGDKITIRTLLNQSSGIPNPMPLSWLHTQQQRDDASFSEQEALEQVLRDYPKLDFEPGTKYAYSNLSYWLLGKVIEKASSMTYSQYMEQEVFTPLGISKDELSADPHNPSTLARGHQPKFSLLTLVFWMMIRKEFWDASAAGWARFQILYMNGPSYGGVFGTALGWAKFLQDLLRPTPQLFSSQTRDLLFQKQVNSTSGEELPTTLGWHQGKLDQEPFYTKPGGGPGFHSNVRVYPGAGIAAVYLANATEVSEGPINAFSDTMDAEVLKGLVQADE